MRRASIDSAPPHNGQTADDRTAADCRLRVSPELHTVQSFKLTRSARFPNQNQSKHW